MRLLGQLFCLELRRFCLYFHGCKFGLGRVPAPLGPSRSPYLAAFLGFAKCFQVDAAVLSCAQWLKLQASAQRCPQRNLLLEAFREAPQQTQQKYAVW